MMPQKYELKTSADSIDMSLTILDSRIWDDLR